MNEKEGLQVGEVRMARLRTRVSRLCARGSSVTRFVSLALSVKVVKDSPRTSVEQLRQVRGQIEVVRWFWPSKNLSEMRFFNHPAPRQCPPSGFVS
jgi:hypothetical protein